MAVGVAPKWASIWSARISDTAMVISACRRSWPWFQRRKSWCMTRPTRPLAPIARAAASHHDMPASCTSVSAT